MLGHPGMKLEQKQRDQERCWPRDYVFPADHAGSFKSDVAVLKRPPLVCWVKFEKLSFMKTRTLYVA